MPTGHGFTVDGIDNSGKNTVVKPVAVPQLAGPPRVRPLRKLTDMRPADA